MRFFALRWSVILAAAFLPGAPALAAADDPAPPPVACSSGIPGGMNCFVSKKELKDAHIAFTRGLKLQNQSRVEEALAEFEEASRRAP